MAHHRTSPASDQSSELGNSNSRKKKPKPKDKASHLGPRPQFNSSSPRYLSSPHYHSSPRRSSSLHSLPHHSPTPETPPSDSRDDVEQEEDSSDEDSENAGSGSDSDADCQNGKRKKSYADGTAPKKP